MIRYYYAGAARIAMRTGTAATQYILSDHLGSTSVTTSSEGVYQSETLYKPCPFRVLREGETRWTSGTLPTKYTYTGQYSYVADFGLMYYNARYYDPLTSRFSQADTLIPNPGDPQSWDRFAYTMNNPVRYTDPSGHDICDEDGNCYDDNRLIKKVQGLTLAYDYNSDFTIGAPVDDGSTIGPGQFPEHSTAAQKLHELFYFSDFMGEAIDAVAFLGDIGKPIYRKVKGVASWGGPVGEGFIGFGLQFSQDLNDPLVPTDTIFGRAIVIGFEDVVTDAVSSFLATKAGEGAAGLGAAACSGGGPAGIGACGITAGVVGYLGVSILSTSIIDDKIWYPFNQKYFPDLFPSD